MSSAERPHSVSVAGVLVDDEGPALLIRCRGDGPWEPPGGVLKPEEMVPQALQREVREEAGLRIAIPSTLTGRTRT